MYIDSVVYAHSIEEYYDLFFKNFHYVKGHKDDAIAIITNPQTCACRTRCVTSHVNKDWLDIVLPVLQNRSLWKKYKQNKKSIVCKAIKDVQVDLVGNNYAVVPNNIKLVQT